MTAYKAPIRDMLFTLRDVGDLDRSRLCRAARRSRTIWSRRFSRRPANSPGTCWRRQPARRQAGLRLQGRRGDDARRRQGGFRRLLRQGWHAMPAKLEYGGKGLPGLVSTPVLRCGRRPIMAFSLCQMLTTGAIAAIDHHGSDEQKALYLPNMVAGDVDRHHEPDRAAGRLRSRRRAHPRRPGWRRTTASPARRSSSPGASTMSPKTSSIWCWRACPTPLPA